MKLKISGSLNLEIENNLIKSKQIFFIEQGDDFLHVFSETQADGNCIVIGDNNVVNGDLVNGKIIKNQKCFFSKIFSFFKKKSFSQPTYKEYSLPLIIDSLKVSGSSKVMFLQDVWIPNIIISGNSEVLFNGILFEANEDISLSGNSSLILKNLNAINLNLKTSGNSSVFFKKAHVRDIFTLNASGNSLIHGKMTSGSFKGTLSGHSSMQNLNLEHK